MSEVRKLTFFISSPGDVYEERTLAQRVMDRVAPGSEVVHTV